ncbi:MAG: type II toxin-antitoxin system RelE/ParE family toxin [Kiloniellaceae bacterium]
MIGSFRHRGLKRLFEHGDRSRIRPDLASRVETILSRLDVAQRIQDMSVHSYRLHPLRGDLTGFWSVTVSGNWRIIFRFEDGNAFDVDLVDYH